MHDSMTFPPPARLTQTNVQQSTTDKSTDWWEQAVVDFVQCACVGALLDEV